MSEKVMLSPTQGLYQKIFGELPKRDIVDVDMPALYEVFGTLPDREIKIIKMRLGLDCTKMTRVAIGKEFDITSSRVAQIEARAIRRLQNEGRAQKIKPLFYTYEEMRMEIDRRDECIYDLQNALRLAKRENTELRKRNKELGENPIISRADLPLAGVLDLAIEELDLSVRTYNCLKRCGLNTMRDVVLRYLDDGLLKVRNLGKRSIEETVSKLTEWGVPLDHPAEYYL